MSDKPIIGKVVFGREVDKTMNRALKRTAEVIPCPNCAEKDTRIEKACDALESLRDSDFVPIEISRKIDNILFDLEGGKESVILEIKEQQDG